MSLALHYWMGGAHHCSFFWSDLYCVEWDVKLYYTIPYTILNLGIDQTMHKTVSPKEEK